MEGVTKSETASQLRSPAHQQLLQHAADALLEILAPHNGVAWTSRILDLHEPSTDDAELQAVAFSLQGALQGTLSLRFDLAASPELQASISQKDADPATGIAQRLAFALRSPLATTLSRVFGPVTLQGTEPQAVPNASLSIGSLEFAAGSTNRTVISIAGDSALGATLQQAALRLANRDGASRTQAPQPKIERVLDVPLAVTLRFGQRQLTLREVLALSTGSLVELDRQVEEPVDLVLGDRLIARGEVVIVDGNYGLRVTEVMEGASQSLRHLHEVHA